MKTIYRIITLVLAIALALPCFAQSKDEISLTVSSDGPTKDEAIKNALRTAIEQAMGAFVSANTTILNDELVKDEIVTLTTGAIKNYKIVSELQKADGSGFYVTADATVSLPHLITYAKNHGSECEFAGNTFGMQMKLWEIQKKNELTALENLLAQVKDLLPQMIHWEMELSGPAQAKYDSNFSKAEYFARYREYDVELGDPILDIESGHAVVKVDSVLYNRINVLKSDDFYVVEATIYASTFPEGNASKATSDRERAKELAKEKKLKEKSSNLSYEERYNRMRYQKENPTPISSDFGSLLADYLEKVSLSNDEASAMGKAGMQISTVWHPGFAMDKKPLYFRNPESEKLINNIYQEIADICCNIVIEDNMGNQSDFYFTEIRHWPVPSSYEYQNVTTPSLKPHVIKGNGYYVTSDLNSFSSIPFEIGSLESNYTSGARYNLLENIPWENSLFPGLIFQGENGSQKLPLFKLVFYIPKEDIGKYSSFKISPK